MIYEFKCEKCGHITEVMTNDAKLKKVECEKCKEKAERIISLSSFRI